jgi:UDP-N-acetylmuramoyl-tripeptide--D-alanyl-D-alanine ligase
MAHLGLAAIAGAVGGRLILGARPPTGEGELPVEGYSIDSRTLRRGDLFFALVGPHHDGHDFVPDALARGAAAAVVSCGGTDVWSGAPALVRVDDTTRALQALGAHVRRARPLRVIGITGSAGKTTAKEMAASVVGARFRTHRSEGNLNNTYGLPLALLRMPDDSEAAVLEMGMSFPGEIARLTEIADPDVGVLLNVLRVHLENFGTLSRVAAAKGEMFRGMRRDAVAIYNADDREAARLGRDFTGRAIPYGLTSRGAEVRAEKVRLEGLGGARFVLRLGAARHPVHLALPGRHNVYNALAAAAAGHALGIDAASIACGLEAVRPAPMRGTLHSLPGGIAVLDDSYNSNPAAIEGAIAILRDASTRGRRILVSGDMLELGPYESRAHTRLGRQVAAAGIDLFVAVGPRSRRSAAAARAAGAGEVHHCTDAHDAAAWLPQRVRPGDLVLVKGSRGMRMERVVRALLSAAGAPGTEEVH